VATPTKPSSTTGRKAGLHPPLRLRGLSASLAAGVFLAACQTTGPDYAAPASPVTLDRFPSGSASAGEAASDAWWTESTDAELRQLIIEGLSANLDLEEAAARVLASRALLRETGTLRGPSATTEATASANRQSVAATGSPGFAAEDRLSPSASLATAWELDLFGRIARQIESSAAEAAALEASRQDLARLIAADIALAYLDLREAQSRTTVAERNLASQRSTLELTGILAENGKASQLDLARSQAQVATTEARIPQLRAQAVSARNRLTSLLALEPGALDHRLAEPASLPELPDVVLTGSPSSVISRRPDVRAAERTLAASAARIGIATADLYPTISLTGSAGFSSADAADFTSGDAFSFNFGPRLTWNLFDRGAIYARIEQADANAAASLARFRQTVLTALEEVDSALSAYNEEGERTERLAQARGASALAQELARARYEAGREPFLTVLDAERVLLAADDEFTVSAAARLRAQIQLYRAIALGGAVPEIIPVTSVPERTP
jgi:NodT family efflux transporter outer membrane factor (OMF) lipoprotein